MAFLKNSHVTSCTTSETTTGEINYRDYSRGTIQIPTGSSITAITWWTRDSEQAATTRAAAYDNTPTTPVAVTQVVAADQSHPIPTTLAGAHYIYPVTNAAGDIYVSMKGD